MDLIAGLLATMGEGPYDLFGFVAALILILVALVGMVVAVIYGGIQAVRGPQEPRTQAAPDKAERIEWRSDSMRPDMPHGSPATHGWRER